MSWSNNPASRIISTIHAVIVSVLALEILSNNGKDLLREVVTLTAMPEEELWQAMFGIMTSYLAFDLIMMLSMPGKGDGTWLVHHIVGGLGMGLIWQLRTAWPVGLYFATTEISTPFLNMRWFLAKNGWGDTVVLKAVTILFVLAFSIVRWSGSIWLAIYISRNIQPILDLHWFVSGYIFFGCSSITCLNLFWSLQIVQMAFGRRKHKSS